MKTKVSNMIGHNGEPVKNQFLIQTPNETIFQSYDSVIAKKTNDGKVILDSQYWDYSTTTGKYRNLFLGEDKKETQNKIKNGIYKLENLN